MVRKMSLSALLLLGGALFLSACFPTLPSSSTSISSSSSSSISVSSSESSSSSSVSSISSSSSDSSSISSSESSSSAAPVVVDIGLFNLENELVTTMTQDEIDDDYVVNLIYDDGSLVPIEFYTIEWDGLDLEAPVQGEYTVVITYLAFTHEVDVTIATTAMTDLRLVDQFGEPLSVLTMGEEKEVIVEAVYADGTIVELEDTMFTVDWDGFDPENIVAGTYNVIVSYLTFTADLTIIVPEAIDLGIMIDASEVDAVILGQTAIDLSGLVVTLVRSDGTIIAIPYGESGYAIPELATFNPTAAGSYVFTVEYLDFEPQTFEVLVIDPNTQASLTIDTTNLQTTWPLNSTAISFEGLQVFFNQNGVVTPLDATQYDMMGTIDTTTPGEYTVYATYAGYASPGIIIHIVSDMGTPTRFFIDHWGIPSVVDFVIYDFDLAIDAVMFRMEMSSGIAVPVDRNLVDVVVLTSGGTEYVGSTDGEGQPLPVPPGNYSIDATYVDSSATTWHDQWVIQVLDSTIDQLGIHVDYTEGAIVLPYGSDINPYELFQKSIIVYRDYENDITTQFWDFYVDWDPEFDAWIPGDYTFTVWDGTFSDTFLITVAPEQPSTLLKTVWVNDYKATLGDLPEHLESMISGSDSSAYIEVILQYSLATFTVYDDGTLIFTGDDYDNAFEVIFGELTTSKSLAIHVNDGTNTTIYHLYIERVESTITLIINGDPIVFDEWGSGTAIVGRDMTSFSYMLTHDPSFTSDITFNGEPVFGPTIMLADGPINYMDISLFNGETEIGYYSINIRRDPIIEGFLINGVLYDETLMDGITYDILLTDYVDTLTITPVYEEGVNLAPYTFTLMNHVEMNEITGPFDIVIGDYFIMADLSLTSTMAPVEFYDIWIRYEPSVDLWNSFIVNGEPQEDIVNFYGIPANDLFVDVSYTYNSSYTLTVYDPGKHVISDAAAGFMAPVFGGENNYLLVLSNGTQFYRYPLTITRYYAGLYFEIDSITVKGESVMMDYWDNELGYVRILETETVTVADVIVTLTSSSTISTYDIMQMSSTKFMIACYNSSTNLLGYYSIAIIPTSADYIEEVLFDYNSWFMQTAPTTYEIFGVELWGTAGLTQYDFIIDIFDDTATLEYNDHTVLSGETLFVTAVLGTNTYVVDITVNGVTKTFTFIVHVADISTPMYDIEVAGTWFSWASSQSDFDYQPMANRYITQYPVILSSLPTSVEVYFDSIDGVTLIDNDTNPTNGTLPVDASFMLPVEGEGDHYWVDYYTVVEGQYHYTIVPIMIPSVIS